MRVVFAIRLPALLVAWLLSLLLVVGTIGDAGAQEEGHVPGRSLGQTSDSEYWRQVRRGDAGRVSIPGPEQGVLIQSGEYDWRAIRNGPLSTYGAWLILGVIAVLAGFFLIRGRVRLKSNFSGKKIERFKEVERFAHWLMAMSFMILGFTGLNMLYGRYVLRPLIGDSTFAWLIQFGKYAHHYVAFAFMIGLALAFILWVAHNIPSRVDLIWFIKGGGIIGSAHPPAKKFNGGQKILFWLIMLGGVSMSMSGLALMFPFETTFFADTFSFVNILGLGLPEKPDSDAGTAIQPDMAWGGCFIHGRDNNRPYLYRNGRYAGRV